MLSLIDGDCTYILSISCLVVVFMINLGNSLAQILGKLFGINRFHRTVVICTFKIQIYLRVFLVIFYEWKYLPDTRIFTEIVHIFLGFYVQL